ncbi:LacI family DNA-binding transcriptional regulator [Pseudomonas sp. GM102]|uniref:LacI family DNA-binding transcriptional regulator n=1 Tax=Pseudomonas sp. GM102 TaxID=1144321 RepID=UPI000318B063|nr:LacI family DNA-binding transcriptional regulator [Pseudomonas sp. GM102]
MSDVAREAGVAIATVDRVLNKRAPVRSGTEKKVLEAAKRLGFALGKLKSLDDIYQENDRSNIRKIAFVLLRSSSPFYQMLAAALTLMSISVPGVRGDSEVFFLDDRPPTQVAETLLELGERFDAIALVSVDHPAINQAIDTLYGRGIPVYALITDLTATHRAGYIGLDNRKAGRTAAWAVAGLSRRTGKIGMLIGDHRFLCQELCEISFRSYIREHCNDFQVLEPRLVYEDAQRAAEATHALLAGHPDLVGLYVSGGGMEGVVEALKESGRARDIVVVCHELTEVTRSALVEGVVDVVLSIRCEQLARTLMETMTRTADSRQNGSASLLLPFDIISAENI